MKSATCLSALLTLVIPSTSTTCDESDLACLVDNRRVSSSSLLQTKQSAHREFFDQGTHEHDVELAAAADDLKVAAADDLLPAAAIDDLQMAAAADNEDLAVAEDPPAAVDDPQMAAAADLQEEALKAVASSMLQTKHTALMPTVGDYAFAAGCTGDLSTITNKSGCAEAFRTLTKSLDRYTNEQVESVISSHPWGHVPKGCILQPLQPPRLYFNTHETGKDNRHFVSLCKIAASTTTTTLPPLIDPWTGKSKPRYQNHRRRHFTKAEQKEHDIMWDNLYGAGGTATATRTPDFTSGRRRGCTIKEPFNHEYYLDECCPGWCKKSNCNNGNCCRDSNGHQC